MKETELAQKFVNYLSDMYDLYFEVYDVDIIGKCDSSVICVEVKKALNFKVIEQAVRNIHLCNYSYIAIPKARSNANCFAFNICEKYGIGVLEYDGYRVHERVKPMLNRKASNRYIRNLNKESMYKRTTPGAKSGETLTAFKVTVEALEMFVRHHPGCDIIDALNNIDHHYGSISSARSNIVKYIDKGIIKNINRKDNKLYFIKEETP